MRPENRHVFIPPAGDHAPTVPAGAAVRRLGGLTMGTKWAAQVCAPPALSLRPLQTAIEAALDTTVCQMSPWKEQSCLSLFNKAQPGTWHELPENLVTVLEYALTVAELTGNAFDPTVGVLVNDWGFGPKVAQGGKSSRQARANALPASDWRALDLDRGLRRVFQPGELHLDLCAIAKGFAVDRLAETLERHDLSSYLVEIGGEIRGAGVKPDGMPRWVALEAPPLAGAVPATRAVVALHNQAIATSGGYHRSRATEIGLVTHLIDPRSGRPLADISSAVSVLAPLCMHADAWATALAVLGPEAGMRVATAQDIAALFTFDDGAGRQQQLLSPAMTAMLE